MEMELIFWIGLSFIVLLFLSLIILSIVNIFSKSEWFCKYLGWHKKPEEIDFDGCSLMG